MHAFICTYCSPVHTYVCHLKYIRMYVCTLVCSHILHTYSLALLFKWCTLHSPGKYEHDVPMPRKIQYHESFGGQRTFSSTINTKCTRGEPDKVWTQKWVCSVCNIHTVHCYLCFTYQRIKLVWFYVCMVIGFSVCVRTCACLCVCSGGEPPYPAAMLAIFSPDTDIY